MTKLDIEREIPAEDQELALELSRSMLTGDPEPASISSVEVERAWRELDAIDPERKRVPSLRRLSKLLGVRVPGPFGEGAHPADRVFGPPRIDPATGRVLRRTRIVCTVGPGSADVETLAALIRAGMDAARLNFSHIDGFEDAKRWVDLLRDAMTSAGRGVPIMGDLQGPKLRVARLARSIELVAGTTLTLTGDPAEASSQPGAVRLHLAPARILEDLKTGDRIYIDDGKVLIRVLDSAARTAEVVEGGPVGSRKGLNLPDTASSMATPTEKDRRDSEIIGALGLEMAVVSFVESASDVRRTRALFEPSVLVGAKIERRKALETIEAIYAASDFIMIARGDGAIEMGDEAMPAIQRRLHALGHRMGIPTGTATQMMESMMTKRQSSRADVSDVALSAFQLADFVMTSAETAGRDAQYPVETVMKMSKVLEAAERAMETGGLSAYE